MKQPGIQQYPGTFLAAKTRSGGRKGTPAAVLRARHRELLLGLRVARWKQHIHGTKMYLLDNKYFHAYAEMVFRTRGIRVTLMRHRCMPLLQQLQCFHRARTTAIKTNNWTAL